MRVDSDSHLAASCGEMSRALDSDVRASISQEQSLKAYDAISKALLGAEQLEDGQLLEIEFLGKSHALPPGAFCLQDGNALALSKLGLVHAFFAARISFQRHGSLQDTAEDPDALFAVSNVILLMDPEHLTAANARKRLVKSASPSSDRVLELVRRDKVYIDSLLTSRLHRHTKSPTLWNHRRWLVETARQHGEAADVVQDIKNVVMIAGERHPKNYYAWWHARWLTELLPEDKRDKVLVELVGATKAWCLRHGGDISGWTFLSFVLMQVDEELRSSIFFTELGNAASFKLVNESRWVYLRTLAASGAIGEMETNHFHPNTFALQERIRKPEDKQVLERAISWFTTFRRE